MRLAFRAMALGARLRPSSESRGSTAMSRSDTSGCYRGMLRVVLGAVLLPLLVLGCLEVQSLKLATNFHAADAAFRQEIETDRLIGAERPRVLAFLKRKRGGKT